MHPAFSVIIFTTLSGVAQGLFLALFSGQVFALTLSPNTINNEFFMFGSAAAFVMLCVGLISSAFHLGHPQRGWRAASQWRTSWLSREVIALPLFIAVTFFYAVAYYLQLSVENILLFGTFGLLINLILFICTGMIYACLKFLREWATPLTIVNFMLIGSASGFTLAAAYAAFSAPELLNLYGNGAILFTIGSFISRAMTLRRNAILKAKPKTTLQTAIGVRHPHITQRSQGQMGGSYNTREFFHHKKESFIRNIKTYFMIVAFVIPAGLLLMGLSTGNTFMLVSAFILQYLGLLGERWHFFAQVNHPQNLYYQTIS